MFFILYASLFILNDDVKIENIKNKQRSESEIITYDKNGRLLCPSTDRVSTHANEKREKNAPWNSNVFLFLMVNHRGWTINQTVPN